MVARGAVGRWRRGLTRRAGRGPGAGMAAAAGSPWQARWLLAAPHRLAFCAAASMLAVSALWWLAVLLARLVPGWVLPWAVSPGLAHSLLMSFGFMPLFFAGFVFTAGPKWLGHGPVAARSLLPPVAASLAGWALFVPGVHAAAPLAASGLAAVAWGWSGFALRFWRLLRTSRAPDRVHARVVGVACGVGASALWLAAGAVLAQREDIARGAQQLGLWGFIALVFVTVAHRMIPHFGASGLPWLDARRPTWLLWLFAATLAIEALAGAAERLVGPLPTALRAAQAAIEAPVAALLLWLALRWRLVPSLRRSLRQRLPAMLYVGFLWFGTALALAATSHGWMAARGAGHSLGLAPLHALAMGFMGSTMIAMVTRVSCGHGGRALVADDFVWRLFQLLQIAVLLRLLGAIWPAAADAAVPLAALAWAAAVVSWALRYGAWYGRPRVDGRAG
jgi:uncharacterized protein involved in response to NO